MPPFFNKLMPCGHCGRHVQSSESECHHCGETLRHEDGSWIRTFVAAVAGLSLAATGASASTGCSTSADDGQGGSTSTSSVGGNLTVSAYGVGPTGGGFPSGGPGGAGGAGGD